MSDSPFTVLNVVEGSTATLPIRWRVGRITSVGFSVGGVTWALAGYFAGLTPSQIAGGECFGGGILVLSGLTVGILLWSLKTNQIPGRKAWAGMSALFLLLGVAFLASSYSKLHKLDSDRRQVRENLEQLSQSLKRAEASKTRRGL